MCPFEIFVIFFWRMFIILVPADPVSIITCRRRFLAQSRNIAKYANCWEFQRVHGRILKKVL